MDTFFVRTVTKEHERISMQDYGLYIIAFYTYDSSAAYIQDLGSGVQYHGANLYLTLF